MSPDFYNFLFLSLPIPKKNATFVDGDTFRGLTSDSTEIRFRLYGIDAPEKTQAFSNVSRQYLSDLFFGKTVGIKIQKKNAQYGRPIVWVYTSEGLDVSTEMLKSGLA